jgi:hypothetical protein
LLKKDKNCYDFAKEVDNIAYKYGHNGSYVFGKKLLVRFEDCGQEFGDRGFKDAFRDVSNQTRHYIGSFAGAMFPFSCQF